VDLEHAVGYELAPGPGNKFVLTLHTGQEVAKNAPANIPAKVPAKTSTPAPKTQTAAAKLVVVPVTAPKVAVAVVPASTPKGGVVAKVAAPKAVTTPVVAPKPGSTPVAATTKIAAQQNSTSAIKKVEPGKPAAAAEPKKWALTGKRDPFFSPVVQQNAGSGCSTGKKCLDIGQINVRGVVKAESGFIAVVTNSLNKAYFLHENDPVFNGFVMRITGDSVVFQETMQDKLGKPFTREVVKRITTPAV
jgi:hypothetical protein